MDKQQIRRASVFAAMVLLMLGLAFFRSENDYDKLYYKAGLARGQELHCTVDLSREGRLKQCLQSNIYTLYLRLQPKEKSVRLRCEAEGVTMLLSQGSKKGLWRQLETGEFLQLQRGRLPLSVELYVERGTAAQQGKIKFYDEQGALYATVLVDVVKSSHQKKSNS